MKESIVVTLMLAAALLRAQPMQGTYMIKKDGSGDFTSFTEAGSALVARGIGGNVVFEAYSGTYNDGMIDMRGAITSSHNVTFRPVAGQSVALGAAGAAAIFLADGNLGQTNNIKIEGLKLFDVSTGGWPIYAVNRLSNWRVSNCDFMTPRGPWFNGYYDSVVGCRMYLTGTLGVYFLNSANCYVANNFVAGATSTCIYFNASSGNLIYHNTFVTDSASTNAMAMYQNQSSNTFYDNIVVSSWVCLYTGSMPGYSDYNCWHRHSGDPALFYLSNVGTLSLLSWRSRSANRLDMHSMDADPLVVDKMADLHLQASSPCINAGTVLSGITVDIDSQPRDAQPDIGADEYYPVGLADDTRYQIPECRLQIEPNPTSGRTLVRFSLDPSIPRTLESSLRLFDASGRCVRQSTIGNRQSTMSLDLRGLPAGVYVVRLTAGETCAGAKLIVR